MTAARIHAPELPDTLKWFNTKTPITLAQLRGKVVLLDFWTYCSMSCMHVLTDLAWLQRRYPEELAVIGIHTPKFPNERIGDNVQKAINRSYIRHPIAHDPTFSLWQKYGIKAWPSIIYIDPEGYICGMLRGEGKRRQLDQMIQKSIKQAESNKTLVRAKTSVDLWPEPELELKFPGKVLATGDRVFISDSAHNRVLECLPNGRINQIYGSASAGHLDSIGEEASFDNPQGLARIANNLYVADTTYHVIRKINLETHEVSTIAGMGKMGRVKTFETFDDPLQAPLNSPWDLVYSDGTLYIAMAGGHQIWAMDLSNNTIRVLAGNGNENLDSGSAESSTFAQPSGIAVGEDIEKNVFVVDAESSSIRAIRIRDSYVRTLLGKGLFDFGEKDGKSNVALMQHPMGIAYDAKRKCLWIADTYNHRIRHLKLLSSTVSSMKLPHELAEPGGISLDGDDLWVANTNAHNIVKINIKTGEMEQVEIFSVETD